jgi:tRNA (mo5U34)-methyltransferase
VSQTQAGERAAAARTAIETNPIWYHTIELAPGVVTPGRIDHREAAPRLLPAELSGRRALDVGTFDGFWAFEMERRGADVVAIDVGSFSDVELPPLNRAFLEARAREWDIELGRGFRLAAEVLGSRARRIACDVYDLSPEAIGGEVDIAFSGDLLLHLRDPVGALERIRSALRPGGTLIALEPFSVTETLRAPRRPVAHFQPLETEFNWWYPNLACLRAWLRTAGFPEVRRTRFLRPPATADMKQWHVCFSAARDS